MESRPCERGLSLQISVLFLSSIIILSSASNFYDDFEITWGDERAKIDHGGQLLTLSLDQISGSGFQSKSEYLFGRIDMQLKLVSGNSAGTVTAYYLSSQGSYHDEIDFEFLGNVTGEPYIVHTNIYTIGEGGREQQFYLWFDPTKDFHTYSIFWNPKVIILLVDNIPIRVFKNKEAIGVPFPKTQPMRIYSSLWDADGWATQGGLVKTDWSNAPFTSSYRNFSAHACVMSLATASSCNMMPKTKRSFIGPKWEAHGLGPKGRKKLRWVQKYYMIYDYCRDFKRFPQGLPLECRPL